MSATDQPKSVVSVPREEDIVDRLRVSWSDRGWVASKKINGLLAEAKEAAGEIERLRALAAAPLPQGEGENDLRWAVYTAAYAVLRDYENSPTKDRGLINAGDVRIPNLIADSVVRRYAALAQPAPAPQVDLGSFSQEAKIPGDDASVSAPDSNEFRTRLVETIYQSLAPVEFCQSRMSYAAAIIAADAVMENLISSIDGKDISQ